MMCLRLVLCVVLMNSVSVPPAWAQGDDALAALVQVLGTSEDPQFHVDILKGMSDGLAGRRGVPMPEGWDEAAARLARSSDRRVRDLAQSLSVTFGSATALRDVRQTMLDSGAKPDARRAALESLLATRQPGLESLLRKLVADPALRGAAIRGLASYDDAGSPEVILAAYGGLGADEKRDALNTLVSRAGFAKALLAAIEQMKLPARDLTADIVRQLRNFTDPALNERVTKLWGAVRESSAEKLKEIARYKQMIQSRPAGDARSGRAVFTRTCQQCHTLFDPGGKVGPDITGSNRGDLDYILQNALDPNAVIPNDYRTSTVETKDDRVITGIVTRQDDTVVMILTANETLTLPRGEMQSVTQSEFSMMPEGLLQALTDEEVCDLIAYLKQPAQVPLP